MNLSRKLQNWVDADLMSASQRTSILDHEKSSAGSRWKSSLGYVGMFSILLGLSLMVAANWQGIADSTKLIGHFLLNITLAALIWRWRDNPDRLVHREGALFALWGLSMTLIAMIGQIYQLSGEVYEAVRLWFWITTPMLLYFAQGRYLTTLWAVFFVFYVPFDLFFSVIDDIADPDIQLTLGLITMLALPIGLWFSGSVPALIRLRPALSESLRRLGVFLILLGASFAGAWFYVGSSASLTLEAGISPAIAIGIGLVTVLGLIAARRLPQWQPEQRAVIDLFILCTVFICQPLTIHITSGLAGMVHFIALWLIAGVLFQRSGHDREVNLCITLVTLRLFIGFVELFGSLMVSGLQFILIGLVLIGLVYAARMVKSKLKEARE